MIHANWGGSGMATHDELGKRLREARAAMDDICDCSSVHNYVTAAGDAWKGGVTNTEDYAEALATAWSAVRKYYLAARPKPTIAELEAILDSEGNAGVQIMPDGSIMAKT